MDDTDLGRLLPDAKDWPMPERRPFVGRYVRLEPLSLDHLDALWDAVRGADDSFTFLKYGPFAERAELGALLGDLSTRADQPFWAVIPEGQGPCGWASICDIYQRDAAIEIGSIWFAPALQGTRAAREALFLLMCHAMDDLGYERLVWRCQAQNAKSFRAAETLGFTHEGTWRRAAIVDGWQRDVAWFSILREEWPARRAALAAWLAPENFDATGRQHRSLRELRPAS
ncbi:RimJ/RimL family protein N-acetyltransferase [Rubricella aquisinus]|uniref:RimJ/RimL family protein N-acetyltransferase n=1 Tax=Rubricella aquisinus TaxID=2028108 RepID=A0A840WZP3_9RHOB|nr:GNAT family protein [Rubricella aquisinus]MBB5515135.1 RimJ/RimL family protein N-acetyltransferase [Rubricella aquisinus]